jgi:hypothetical protein
MGKIIKGIIFSVFCLIILATEVKATENHKSLSFKISGKYGTLNLSNLNSFLSDTEVYYDTLLQPYGFTKANAMKGFRNSTEMNIEFLMQLSKHFGIGLEVGYSSKTQNIDIVWESSEYGKFSLDVKPTMNFIPIVLSGYFFLPLNSVARAYIKGGTGIYEFNSKFMFDENSQIEGEEFFSSSKFIVDGKGLGLNGGIGLEFDFGSSMAFFIEGTGRYTNFNSRDGYLHIVDSQGVRFKEGNTWFFEYYDENISRYLSGITYGDKPEGDDVRNVHRLKIKLSGFSIRVGFRIGLGNWE